MEEQFTLTTEGRKNLEARLAFLKNQKLKDLNQQIKKARGFCDFFEDVSFREMVDEKSLLEKEIKTLEETLSRSEQMPVKELETEIGLGDTVSFVEMPLGETETYQIVSRAEANLSEQKISNTSPMAQQLLGRKLGDEVDIKTPDGRLTVKITQINSFH